MIIAEDYLNGSRVFRHLKNGVHGALVERYAAHLVEVGLAGQGIWRCLNLVRDLLAWISRCRTKLTNLDERKMELFLRHRGKKQTIQPGDRAALKRWLLILRSTNTVAPPVHSQAAPHDQIFAEFSGYLRTERGLAERTIVRHLPTLRRFLCEVCPAGFSDLSAVTQKEVIRYIERHAQDRSPRSGKAMCWSIRAFLRYSHHTGRSPLALDGCVPSIRQWKLASLPTFLSAAQVQMVLDGSDRATPMGRRDYAILMLLTKLGLRANEVATLTLDDVDWKAGEVLVRAKGRQQVRMPIAQDVGTALVAYLRDGRPTSSCRRFFLRNLAPHIGFASASAVSMIAKAALERVNIRGYAHHGAHIFRHSLATELLRSDASLTEIGQLLRHKSHDTTRIYAKVDVEALRTLSLPWPGGA